MAVRMNTGIEIDGRLDEIAWSEAPPITDFTQNDPNEGQPVSEPTEVRVRVGRGAPFGIRSDVGFMAVSCILIL